MLFLDPLLGAIAYGAELWYVLRWHERTSWRRRGTKLGAIYVGAELNCVHKARLS
jgi:hypothetical protein